MVTADTVENYTLDTDTSNILTLIIHYCYDNKDVFLRELISNSSDACDKIRFQSIEDADLMKDDKLLRIRVVPHADKKQLHIIDSGIGMTKQELIKNLGTIAKSGTRKFLENIKKGDMSKVNQIGQFGIGFYSSFLVSDRVAVYSKSPNDDMVYKWESDGSTQYTVTPMPDFDLKRGTHIIMDIKEGCEEFLKETTVENTIKKYSSYIPYPIYLEVQKSKEVDEDEEESAKDKTDDVDAESKKDEEKDNADKDKEEDGKIEEKPVESEKPKKKKTIKYSEDKHLNSEEKIWEKEPNAITEEDAEKAYKSLTKSWQKPFMYKAHKVEGASTFSLIIFIHPSPKTEVFESKTTGGTEHARLFNRGVFLQSCDKKNPLLVEQAFQSMCYAVINTQQAPYGISRDKYLTPNFMKLIGKYTKNSIYQMLNSLKKDHAEKYAEFKKKYTPSLKLAVHEDALGGAKLVDHISFENTKDNKELSLSEYCEGMKNNQDKIYYSIGANREEILADETVKELQKMDKNVLCFYNQLDEIMINKLREFQGKKFQDIHKEGFVLYDDEDSKKKFEECKEEYKEFLAKVKTILGSKVSDVKLSNNLKEPFAIQVPDYALSPQMEIMHENQPLSNNAMSFFNRSSKTLVFNPFHPFTANVKALVMSDKKIVNEFISLLHNLAVFKSGYPLKDRMSFSNQVFKMCEMAIGNGPTTSVDENNSNINTDLNGNNVAKNTADKPDISATDSNLNEVD